MLCENEFEIFVEKLLENAVSEYKKTEEYRLLQEKHTQMIFDCDTLLTANEKEFAFECFDLIGEEHEKEKIYIYHKGLLDSVKILKSLNVLR